jgi:hypothetical protein
MFSRCTNCTGALLSGPNMLAVHNKGGVWCRHAEHILSHCFVNSLGLTPQWALQPSTAHAFTHHICKKANRCSVDTPIAQACCHHDPTCLLCTNMHRAGTCMLAHMLRRCCLHPLGLTPQWPSAAAESNQPNLSETGTAIAEQPLPPQNKHFTLITRAQQPKQKAVAMIDTTKRQR